MEENTDSMAARGEMSLRSVHVMQAAPGRSRKARATLSEAVSYCPRASQTRVSLSFGAWGCAACGCAFFPRADALLLNMRRAHDVIGNVISPGPRNRLLMQLTFLALHIYSCGWQVTCGIQHSSLQQRLNKVL